MKEIPVIFISHGAPDLLLSQEPARQALSRLGQFLPRPKGILVVSAHWQATDFTLGEAPEYKTIHDFSGFPSPLYRLKYPAKSSKWLSELCQAGLERAAIDFAVDSNRGLDHGAWIPLMLAWPEAEIPVLSLSLKVGSSPQESLELGHALSRLHQKGVLVVASGAITHNLGELLSPGSPPEFWAQEFTHWLEETLREGRTEDLLKYLDRAPFARRAHPTTEHFEPLLVAYGAGGETPGCRLHHSYSYGNMAMDIYAFGTDCTGLKNILEDSEQRAV